MNDDILDEDEAYIPYNHKVNKFTRFINGFVDLMVCFFLSSRFSPTSYILPYILYSVFNFPENSDFIRIYIFPLINSLFYFFFLEVSTQQTIGKIVTRTKVFTVEGYKPTSVQIFIRTITRLIPIDAISFLFNYNLHDKVSKTIVTKISKF